MKQCSVDGCEKPARTRGWCPNHYQNWRTKGDPLAYKVKTRPGEVLKWIHSVALIFDEDDCLTWPFSRTSNGYGKLGVGGRIEVASRYICILVNGDPPEPHYEAAHSCGKGHEGCVNPKHLSWKTKVENQADKFSHGTSNAGSKHGMAKLSEDQVLEMRSLADSVDWDNLAIRYGVTRSTVSLIARRRIWTHI